IKAKGRVLALYREARAIDPQNTLASDALRGLGRGAKNWRSTSALLPMPGEESLTIEERASQLYELGNQYIDTEPAQATDWFERAVAVNPDLVEAWEALSYIGLDRRDFEYSYLMAEQAVHAYERTTHPGSSGATAILAQRLAKTAELAQSANHHDEALALSTAAYALDPTVPSAALLVADARFDAGSTEIAGQMYATIVGQLGRELEPKQRAHALHRKGRSMIEKGELSAAREDLRKALDAVPLFPPALGSMAEVLRKQGHPVSAALHELKALLVTRDTEKRGLICRRLGELCDGDLKRPDEAGAWFELAVESGVEDKRIMRRLLEHFRRTGRASQALTAIEDLISAATDPVESAELWAAQGSILADTDLDAAEEALDTALSYDPTHPAALATLSRVLEGRGDYDQLASLLEARSETGTMHERVAIIEKLADMCISKLNDPERAEGYLHRLIELAPTADAIEKLLSVVRSNPDRQHELLPLIAHLMSMGENASISLCDCITEASQLVHKTGQRHWTWALLSALAGAAPVDVWIKSTLADLRREFERFDSLTLLHPYLVTSLGAIPAFNPLQVQLSNLCARVFVRTDEVNGTPVDGRTGPGKVFERVTEQLNMPGKLMRATDGGEGTTVLAGEVPTVVVRSDLLTASPGELTYIFVRGLMLARPECLALASVPLEARPRLIQAINAATDESAALVDDPAVASLAATFAYKLDRDEMLDWRRHLDDLSAAETLAASAFQTIEEAAMRVAAVAAGDARTALRAVARLSPDGRRPPSVAKLEEFEIYYSSVPQIARLFAFFASEDFGRVIRASA
ncbi:MAG: hypothetical protein FWD57_16225, partial [Polyangiaceae bacterium]|nr:hypothetical protein [Polyangiaceae bacterium]